MASKRKTMAQRRSDFMNTLGCMFANADKYGYLQGVRAADPSKYDNAETRERENAAHDNAREWQRDAIRQFNAAVRAARRTNGK